MVTTLQDYPIVPPIRVKDTPRPRKLVVPITAEFPLDHASRAHERLAAGHVQGNIVLRVQPA